MDQALIPAPPPRTPGFKKGRKKTGGRKPRIENRLPKLVKDAVLMAAEANGSDGKGKDGLLGFMLRAIDEDFRGFLMLLGRIMPMQVETRTDLKTEIVYRSVTEIRREMASRGIDMKAIAKLIEHEAEMVDIDAVGTED